MDATTSLQNLQEIVVPEPPPLWPPAPGVWVLLVVVLAVFTALVLGWLRVRARNAYRRAGLALLKHARTTREVDVVLKRVALAVFPRPEVAPLYGDDWAAFLDGTCSRTSFVSMGATDPGAEPSRDVLTLANRWIRHHRVPSGRRTGGA